MHNTIHIIKRNYRGEVAWEYDGEIVERGEHFVCLQAYFGIDDRDDGYFLWQRGDRMVEWFFTDRWYNVFRIHDRDDDQVRGWYCNITYPAVITETSVTWDDLELDMFIFPDSRFLLLDEEGFEALPLTAEVRAAALAGIEEIQRLATQQEAMFAAAVEG